jgi:hypothetical protein
MCAARFPWLDKSQHKVEWGLQCQGCKRKIARIDGKLDWNWLHTEKGYPKHVRQCPKSLETLKSLVSGSSTGDIVDKAKEQVMKALNYG